MGLDAFKAEVESRLGYSLAPARPYTFIRNVDNGGHHVMLFLKNGRIQDEPQRDFNPGLREIDMIFKGTFQRVSSDFVELLIKFHLIDF
jgi:sulfite reductase (NADPH) hemoprotein beta-component